jgi:outer membrane protein TolC
LLFLEKPAFIPASLGLLLLFTMKFLRPALLISLLAAPFVGCVDVDKDTADTARDYWQPSKDAQPKEALALPAPKPGSGGDQAGTGQLGLPALVDIALANNPTTRQAWYQAKAAAALLGETNSQYYPQITVNATLSRDKLRSVQFNGITQGAGTNWSTFRGPSVEINYVLWNFEKNYAQSDAARQTLYAANYVYNQQIQDVILATELAYFNFNAGLGFVDAAKATLKDAQTSYDAANQKLTTGLGNKQDMLQALAQVKNAEFQLEQAQAQVETARSQLAFALGVPVTDGLDIVPNQTPPELTGLNQEISSLLAEAMRQRPTLMAAYANVQAAKYDLAAARDNRWPVVSAVADGTYGYYSSGATNGNPYNNYSAGIQVSWDIFTGFNNTYSIINAQEQERAAEQSLRTQELQVVSDVWNFYYSFQSAQRQVESTKSQVAAQLEAYNAIHLGYQNGLNSYVDEVTALDNLATARQQQVTANANLGTAISNLAHAIGDLPLDKYTGSAATEPTPPMTTPAPDSTTPTTSAAPAADTTTAPATTPATTMAPAANP